MLSVFVLFIHMSSFAQPYPIEGSAYEGIIECINVFFRKSFVLTAVPLFFIISGATFFRDYKPSDYKKRLISRAKSILIPYLIWNTVNTLFELVISNTPISNYFAGREIVEINIRNILTGIFFYTSYGPFWFIFNLMIFIAITPLIYLIISKKRIAIPVMAGLLVLQTFGINLPEAMFFEAESLVYYIFGAFIGKYCFDWFASESSSKAHALGGIGILASTAFFFAQGIKLFTLPDSVNAVVKIIASLSLWIVVDKLFRSIPVKNFMCDSFIVYATHDSLRSVFIKLFYLLFLKHPMMAVLNFFVASALTIITICVFCAFMRKFFPRIFAVISGSRVSKRALKAN